MNNYLSKNILLATFGNWELIPETLGYVSPDSCDFYKDYPERTKYLRDVQNKIGISKIDEVWLITTSGDYFQNNKEKLDQWVSQYENSPIIKYLSSENISDLNSEEDCRYMSDLVYRAVLLANAEKRTGKLVISLAGGRKTMSADMQRAATIFACDAIIHVIESSNKNIVPMIVSGKIESSSILYMKKIISTEDYPIKCNENLNIISNSSSLYNEIELRLKDSANTAHNYLNFISGDELSSNFRTLYTIHPAKIKSIREIIFGIDKSRYDIEYSFIKLLPKADLHCHFGGIAQCAEIVKIALANKDQILKAKEANIDFRMFLEQIDEQVKNRDVVKIKEHLGIGGIKRLRTKFSDLKEPLCVCGFISCFETNPKLLDDLIFEDLIAEDVYCGVGINKYETLGDIQGSAILQSKESIISACNVLSGYCKEHNVQYLELRCSPAKYTRGGLTKEEVLETIIKSLKTNTATKFSLILIASRHGDEKEILEHVDLALKYRDFSKRVKIAGFDLAGNEQAKKPSELRDLFLPIMEKSLKITIHAGETQSVDNIWEAVYHLNADRIGHGLTLKDKKELFQHFADRKIAVELCPSSNYQIVGYRDNYIEHSKSLPEYPLKLYLDSGIKTTVNTDNIGISRTNTTNEYIKAARLTACGLSLWNILKLIKNGFTRGFVSYKDNKIMVSKVEQELVEILNSNLSDLM